MGTGDVLVRADGCFKSVFTAMADDATKGTLSADPAVPPVPMHAMSFTSVPGDIVVLATGAACQALTSEFGGPFFFGEWDRPRDLVEFLWQASARMDHSGPDRSMICLWDEGSATAPRT